MMKRKGWCGLAAALWMLACTTPVAAQEAAEAQELVEAALTSFGRLVSEPSMAWLGDHMKEARAILIVPNLVKGGFILGGSGGNGVLLAHDPQTGDWSDPAFCRLTSVTMGLQVGAQVSELALMVMTEDALQSLLVDQIQLGGKLSIALGPFSTGATAARADIIAFSRTKGVYGGLTLEGATFSIQDQLNQAYYGRAVDPADILLGHAVSNEQAEPLRMVLAEASERK